MSTIGQVFLPGIGSKFQIETMAGDWLIVVIHDDGKGEDRDYVTNVTTSFATNFNLGG
ncbi:MAG TPA: hypothetical protein VIX17_23390 [Pyrinomonadaceae bacterium]|jgi:K+/H+ antiporter YhaU regulatory subunit KhtT